MTDIVNLTIDGKPVSVAKGTTVLEAARQAGVNIPTLCFLKEINEIGACRMCVVDVGARSLQAACVYPVAEGLKVSTNSTKVRESRRTTLELILSNHEHKCFTCSRSDNCELQKLANDHNIKEIRYEGEMLDFPIDNSSLSVVRDPKKVCPLPPLRQHVQERADRFRHRNQRTRIQDDRPPPRSTCP